MKKINTCANVQSSPISLPPLNSLLNKNKSLISKVLCHSQQQQDQPIGFIKSIEFPLLDTSINLDADMDMQYTSREVKIVRFSKLIKVSNLQLRQMIVKIEQVTLKNKLIEKNMRKLFKRIAETHDCLVIK